MRKRKRSWGRVALWAVSTGIYAYGIGQCFGWDPAGLGIFPGLTAGAGAIGILAAMGWTAAIHGRARDRGW